ncbi:MAG: potassium channel family protein [Burkholderiales bacterium]
MITVVLSCLFLIALATIIHYEALRMLNARLSRLAIPGRTKLLAVMFAAFVAHGIEIGVYGAALFLLVKYLSVGTLAGPAGFTLVNCLYFSAETYTSLGFGDLTPQGPIRLLAGVEALNGLLLIGWSASYAYIAMERFWRVNEEARSD